MRKILLLITLTFIFIMTASQKVCAENYSDYSNKAVAFGLSLRTDHKKPDCEKPSGVKLSDYDTYYCDEKAYENGEKVIYLTFDAGYENGNTASILDALKDADVKAIFFVTTPYIKENPDLVKRMKEEGHLVGNHTTTHPSLPDCSVSKIKKEMSECAATMEKLTGYTPDPFMRPPMGHYSERVMKVMQDLGYNTMLWSLAIYDYEENDQPGADYVVEKFKKHHFCGMMPLLHVISSSDAEALPEIISSMEDEGYRFGQVSEFTTGINEEDSSMEDQPAKEEAIKNITLNVEKLKTAVESAMCGAVTKLLKGGV